MANEKLIAQVASLQTEVKNVGDDVREMKQDNKDEREIFWNTFRSHEKKLDKDEKTMIITLNEIRNDLKSYKGECDNRQKEANSKLRSVDRRFKMKMSAIITLVTVGVTVLSNLFIATAKAKGWLA